MSRADPDELTLVAAYADRTIIFSWRPAAPGLAVLIASCGDEAGADQTVRLEQTKDSDAMLRLLRRLVLQLPAGAFDNPPTDSATLDVGQQAGE